MSYIKIILEAIFHLSVNGTSVSISLKKKVRVSVGGGVEKD